MQIMLLVFEFQIYRFIFLHIFKKHVHQKLVCYSLTMRKIVLLMYISINTEKLFLLKIWPTLLKYHISKDVYVFYKLFLYRIVFHLHCTYFICIVLFCHLYYSVYYPFPTKTEMFCKHCVKVDFQTTSTRQLYFSCNRYVIKIFIMNRKSQFKLLSGCDCYFSILPDSSKLLMQYIFIEYLYLITPS